MSETAFYWGPICTLHAISMALWIGSIFYYAFGVQSCLSLLDPTQKNSVQLQCLRKLFQFSWISGPIAFITQATLLISPSFKDHTLWAVYGSILLILIMIVMQFYIFTTSYRKARRALRPKPNLFTQINNPLKLIVFLGIIDFVLTYIS
ncbi:hypothetical protein [Commensalibacter oyaizuii]|uniref:Copper resistance protein D domain-containing protein n=1 Tax=Commensalibacter oyaizuii TaxID=3043873 RepID=A0ABT6PZW2_9PROT|nr:hypothetical protein [Commensalibacter sp. TBRC 16381]MDI2090391.1 hypothetical protein [Commensalibacter sp. TBRC 16381]